jgi:PAS domain S-box-containing protein
MENISKSPFTKRSSELILVLILGFILTLAASNYNLFESVVFFVENYDREGLGLLIILSIYTSFGMGIFSLKKWIELENTLIFYREVKDNLKEKEKMYRALFEQSNDAVIVSDGKKVLDINKKGCEIFGFEQSDPNVSLVSFIPGAYLPEFQQALKETFKWDSSHFEMSYKKPDGEIIDIDISLSLLDRKDNIVQILAQDVTDRKNAERWEQETRERLKTILDNTLCGILLIEASSRKVVDANPVALKTTGYSEKELIGTVCNQVICQPGEEICTAGPMDQAGDLSEGILFRAGGEPIPILRSIVPVSIGENGYFVESFIDLSDRKKAEEELLQAKLAAEGANRAMSEFLATMSHELRTPLTAIVGFSELMLGGTTGEFDELNKKFLVNISSSGKHLLSLINSILDLSEIEAGKMDIELDYFSLQDIFTETKQIISPLAQKKKISMSFDAEPGFIYADKTRFKQIMYNLINNAIKFTPSGGSVNVLGLRSENWIKVTVSDTGIGISKEDIKYLFKPFKQIDSSLSRKYEGTGLGLVLTKKFVEMHRGRIWVDSEPGKGSTFTFEIPATILETREKLKTPKICEENEVNTLETSDNKMETPESETGDHKGNFEVKDFPEIIEPEGSDGSEPLVMVVEDDEVSRELLIFTLKDAGYRVTTAASGKQALFFAKKLKPFVITLDLVLPEMSGWEVLKNLKKDRETIGIPVLILSIDDKSECNMLWGAFDHLVKPVEKSILLSTLDRLKKKTIKKSSKILIVDDQESMVELIASLVKEEGYTINQAYGGKEAIEKALADLPDALILDLAMPDLSGFEVIRALKKNPETVDIPIIVCTAKDLSAQDMKTLNSSVSFVMQKEDLSKDTLLKLMKRLEMNEKGCETHVFPAA